MALGLPHTVALVGATGAIGKSVAATLHEKGRLYRVISRSRTVLEKTFGNDPLAEAAVWDPDNKQSIRDALRGVAAVVYMVGVPYTEFHLHPILMGRVIDAAIAEKVDRLLLIGTLHVFGWPQSPRVTESPQESLTLSRAESARGRLRYMMAGKTMLRFLGLFDPSLREFVEMHYLLTDPLIVDDSALQQLLGTITKMPYREGVRQSLAAIS